MKKLLLITGQHRSGTSALTGSLEKLGGFLGLEQVRRKDKHNPNGYFENRRLLTLHSEALQLAGSPTGWVVSQPLRDGIENHPKMIGVINRLVPILEQEFEAAGGRVFVVKDPRIGILMPMYLKAIERIGDVKLSVIFSDRRDEETFRSLQARNGFDRAKCISLAKAHRDAHEKYKASFDGICLNTFDCLSYKTDKLLDWLNNRFDLGLDMSKMGEIFKVLDLKLRNHRVGGNVKVISTYFGPRRTHPSMVQETIDYLKRVVQLERQTDSGMFGDTIIVNHDVSEIWPDAKLGLEYLASIDGTPTRRGVIKVVNRPWDEGRGASFGSFSYAFEKFMDEYTGYWFFSEDSVIQLSDGYFRECVDRLKSDNGCFVCAFDWHHEGMDDRGLENTAKGHPVHCHGGCGAVHSQDLKKVYDDRGCLPHYQEPMPPEMIRSIASGIPYRMDDETGRRWYRQFELKGEIDFTNVYDEMDIGRLVDLNAGSLCEWRGKVF